jgi:hypothetical protein
VKVKEGDVAEGQVDARVAFSTMFLRVRAVHSAGIGRKNHGEEWVLQKLDIARRALHHRTTPS